MEREFIDILTDLDNGEVHNQLTTLLPETTAAVMATGKAGAITLTLKLTKQGNMCVLHADVKAKKPAPATDATLFFVDADGCLRRDDPRQQELKGLDPLPQSAELRTVPTITDHGLVTRKGA